MWLSTSLKDTSSLYHSGTTHVLNVANRASPDCAGCPSSFQSECVASGVSEDIPRPLAVETILYSATKETSV